MCQPAQYRFDPDVQWLRIKGAGSLDAKHAGVLRQLVVWRDQAARETDVPPRAFLRDEILIDMARSPIRSVDKLERVKGLPRPVEAQYGHAIVEATTRGLAEPPTNMPDAANQEPPPTDKYKADALLAAAPGDRVRQGDRPGPGRQPGGFHRAVLPIAGRGGRRRPTRDDRLAPRRDRRRRGRPVQDRQGVRLSVGERVGIRRRPRPPAAAGFAPRGTGVSPVLGRTRGGRLGLPTRPCVSTVSTGETPVPRGAKPAPHPFSARSDSISASSVTTRIAYLVHLPPARLDLLERPLGPVLRPPLGRAGARLQGGHVLARPPVLPVHAPAERAAS
jgi:hypothetical protein